ncbi:hypothetical protein [Streptomyces sp. NPDC002889]|uniref:hypothetical protein n=1 Tax=Streptomyces sp. NPDC002889 TaxID=3364669 RepID=UPI003699335A
MAIDAPEMPGNQAGASVCRDIPHRPLVGFHLAGWGWLSAVEQVGMFVAQAEFVEREFVLATRNVSRSSGDLAPVISSPLVESLNRGFRTRVVLARKGWAKSPWPVCAT